MFAFVCPIRHPDTSNNYSEVIKQLALTIESVCSQKTIETYKFIVVCNVIPNIILPKHCKDKVEFVAVNFPLPENKKGTQVSLDAVKFDKGTKIGTGLLYLKKYNPDYVFIIDGDDWVNTNVIESVKNKDIDLWFANSGYIVNYQNQTYIKKYGVCRYCGSTFIYKYKVLMEISGLIALTDEQPTQAYLSNNINEHILKNILGNHRHQLPFYKQKGLTTRAIPIPTISWILNTGENHTGKDGGKYGLNITHAFLQTFGLASISLSPEKTSMMSRLKSNIDSLQSWFGWLMTNKRNDKV